MCQIRAKFRDANINEVHLFFGLLNAYYSLIHMCKGQIKSINQYTICCEGWS